MASIYSGPNIIMEEVYNQSFPKGRDVIETLRTNPVGLICILNHGDTTKIRVYGPDSRNLSYFIWSFKSQDLGSGLNSLNNRNHPMIFYSPVCKTVPFDNKTEINLGESFTIGKDYGGPVYIGFTRNIKIEYSVSVSKKFANRLKNNSYVLGVADALSVSDCDKLYSDIINRQDISIIHAYIGDPALEIWTDTPSQYNNVNISRTDNSLTITGINEDSTVVSYCDNSGAIRKKHASTSVTLSNTSPNASVMLYRHNFIPYIIPMFIQNTILKKSQYVIASDVTCGQFVNSNRVKGAVVVKEGVEYEIEATGTVSLQDGFIVEKGATFAVYPSCF